MINSKAQSDNLYYGEIRSGIVEIVAEISESHKRVLEIGCGNGITLEAIKQNGAEYVCGLELREDVAELARSRVAIDEVLCRNVEQISNLSDLGLFNVIIASHVLEHMVDPWLVCRKIHEAIMPDGSFVGAVPNVRHASVLIPLLFKGEWKYRESGVMDWTHLRFFTKQTLIEMLSDAGFNDIRVYPDINGPKSNMIKYISCGLLVNFSAFAYNFIAKKRSKS